MKLTAQRVQFWWDWLIRALFAASALILIAMALTGCNYWVKVRDPVPVLHIVYVDFPCRERIHGCANLAALTIELRKGMTPAQRDCVEAHERKHFAGFDHENGTHYAIDCGNGQMWAVQP